MNDSGNETSANAANQVINTTQPTPLRGYHVRGVKKVDTVQCVKSEGGTDGKDLIITVNKADYNEDIHGPLFVEELLIRRKKSKKKRSQSKE